MFGGQLLEPPKKLVLSDTFWREYKCFLNCGACCLAFSLDFLPYEWFKLEEQKAGRWQMVQANGRTREVISIVPEVLTLIDIAIEEERFDRVVVAVTN